MQKFKLLLSSFLIAFLPTTCAAWTGSDSFGYTARDSAEPNGPTYFFEDISGLGTNLSLADDGSSSISLPFTFRFYGINYSSIYVCNNGFISFIDSTCPAFNDDIPNTEAPNGAIYLFWDDLCNSPATGPWYHTRGEAPHRIFIIQWKHDIFFGGCATTGSTGEFQIVLFENETGKIQLNYKDVNWTAGSSNQSESATIGIENADGTIALKRSYNLAVINDSLAINFAHPPPPTPPNITSYWNSKTLASPTLGVNTSELVSFYVTADQKADIRWYENNARIQTNVSLPAETRAYLNRSWSTAGTYTIQVDASNVNGTSSKIRWNVTVSKLVIHKPAEATAGKTLKVTIKDQSETPVQDARVYFTLNEGFPSRNDTNADGQAFFKPLLAGYLKIEAEKDGYVSADVVNISVAPCTENWDCTAWSECVNGVQTRTCTDLNDCGTTQNKPAESQSCQVREAPVGAVGVAIAAPTPTPVPYRIIEAQSKRVDLKAGETTSIIFTKTDVSEISIVPYKSMSAYIEILKIVYIVEPEFSDPSGILYYYNIINSNIRDTDIQSAKIKIKVKKSWVESEKIDADSVKLNRLVSDKWNILQTHRLDGEDGTYFYYEAQTPGFSVFAITGEPAALKPAPIVETPEVEVPTTPTPTVTPVQPPFDLTLIGGGMAIVLALLITILLVVKVIIHRGRTGEAVEGVGIGGGGEIAVEEEPEAPEIEKRTNGPPLKTLSETEIREREGKVREFLEDLEKYRREGLISEESYKELKEKNEKELHELEERRKKIEKEKKRLKEKKRRKEAEEEPRKLKSEAEKLEKELLNLHNQYFEGKISEGKYEEKRKRVEENLIEIKKKIEKFAP